MVFLSLLQSAGPETSSESNNQLRLGRRVLEMTYMHTHGGILIHMHTTAHMHTNIDTQTHTNTHTHKHTNPVPQSTSPQSTPELFPVPEAQ